MLSFLLNLSDSKSLQVFRTLLCILVGFSSVVVWMFLVLPLITSPNFFPTFLETVPRINYDSYRCLHVPLFFFLSLWQDLGICPAFHLHFRFSPLERQNEQVDVLFLLLIKARSGWSVCILNSWSSRLVRLQNTLTLSLLRGKTPPTRTQRVSSYDTKQCDG